jgi:hypothetical protein
MGSPPVLYLTDDEDETSDRELERNFSFHMKNEHLPRKKRKLPNTAAFGTSPMSHWLRRPRHDTYQPEPIVMDSDEEPHSFQTFDWTIEQRTPAHVNGYSHQPIPRASTMPSSNIMHLLEQYARQPDNLLPMPMYQPRFRFPASPPPMPLSLPLPRPTSSLAHVSSQQRSESRKTMPIPYASSVSLGRKKFPKQRRQPPVYLASRNIPISSSDRSGDLPPTNFDLNVTTGISRRHSSSTVARYRYSRRPP